MEMQFLQLLMGTLISIPINLATNLLASKIYQDISEVELFDLIAHCLEQSVIKNMARLRSFSLQPGPDPHIDFEQLRSSLENNELIDPLTIPSNEGNVAHIWSQYFEPLKEVIVIPGMQSDDPNYLVLIDLVVKDASILFHAEVPGSYPIFEK